MISFLVLDNNLVGAGHNAFSAWQVTDTWDAVCEKQHDGYETEELSES